MELGKLIELLQQFDPSLEVAIADVAEHYVSPTVTKESIALTVKDVDTYDERGTVKALLIDCD